MTCRSLFLAAVVGLLLACRDRAPAEATPSDATPTTIPRPQETASADAALPSASVDPEPEPPGPPPPPAVDKGSLLKAVRASYPQAAMGATARPGTVTITFGPGPTADNASTFTAAFLKRHQGVLGAGPLSAVFSSERGGHAVRTAFGNPPRDTGCRRVRLAIELDGAAPVALEHTCERFAKSPPRYASRALPSSAKGTVDILARVGWVGGIAGPLFSGYVLDRYGDVYEASDDLRPMGSEPKPFLDEYVKTLPKAEVEQFLADVAASKDQPPSPSPPPGGADMGGAVVDAFVGKESLSIARIDHPAAKRAAAWVKGAVGR